MSEDPELVLKRRLAEGAISIDQYRELIAEIRPSVPNATKAFGTSTAPLGRKLAECDDLVVYETGLVFRGRQHPVDSVTSVRGGQSSSSINFVPTEKSTSLSIALVDGDTISLQEQRILFGGSRHKALLQTLATLRQITFKPRLINLVVKLKKQGFIELSRPMFGNGETVTLSVDGTVSAGARSISLKQAKASGTFGVRLELANPGLKLPAGIKCRANFANVGAGRPAPPSVGATRLRRPMPVTPEKPM